MKQETGRGMKDLAPNSAQTRKTWSSRRNAGRSLGLVLKEGEKEGSKDQPGQVCFSFKKRLRPFRYCCWFIPGIALLETDLAMLTRFGLDISFLELYPKETPSKVSEQSVIYVVKN